MKFRLARVALTACIATVSLATVDYWKGCAQDFCHAAELVRLTSENWAEYAPVGKEADCIYGDYVLRNDRIVAVIAQPKQGRNANMTVRNVGGAVIDLSVRGEGPKPRPNQREVEGTLGAWQTNDQLSAFYPLAGRFQWQLAEKASAESVAEQEGSEATAGGDSARADVGEANQASLRLIGEARKESSDEIGSPRRAELVYTVRDGTPWLEVVSTIPSPNDASMPTRLEDTLRADGEFEFGYEASLGLGWAYDSHWGQAYGFIAAGGDHPLVAFESSGGRGTRLLRYAANETEELTIEARQRPSLTRLVIPSNDLAGVMALARQAAGEQLVEISCEAADGAGPVAHAVVEIASADGNRYAEARTDVRGRVTTQLPPGRYQLTASSPAHEPRSVEVELAPGPEASCRIALETPGHVVAQIVDQQGEPIPCKVQFLGGDSTRSPDFGPDSAVHGVRNVYYTPTGDFRLPMLPGRYVAVISRGPEFDAVEKSVQIKRGAETPLEATLVRSVDTSGWISADFHSHASPSGDNTASQRGRVLNLLAEHIEFAPCTEHNRVTVYDDHLEHFDLVGEMATCPGIELTGSPLPLNHQNAFPIVHRHRTQDGGGPQTDVNPVAQIERLAMWDDNSDKLIQTNHPNIVQMLGDRDQDGVADGGFERMFHVMDVIEVHPPGEIFNKPESLPANSREPGNVIFNWLQLLNLGYRVPGVVNTDAHWNFHGSGWLRNYIWSSTDDPGEASVEELVEASRRGNMVMTNGPFLEVWAQDAEESSRAARPGGDLVAGQGRVSLHIRVQCPNWLAVNRVQVFINGRPDPTLNFTSREDRDLFDARPVVFETTVPLQLSSDAHVIVATIGEGEQLGVVVGPDAGVTEPVAVSNPIFVDVDGGGFRANGDMLDLPLPVESPQ